MLDHTEDQQIQVSITLPVEMAEQVKNRVSSGAYASESEVIRDGLRALFTQDEAIERWLREEVAQAYDEYKADPSQVIPVSEVRQRLHEQREALKKHNQQEAA